MGICQDITERKETEQKLRAANEALGEELKERIRAERERSAPSSSTLKKNSVRGLPESCTMISAEQIDELSIAACNLKNRIRDENADARGQSEHIQHKLIHLSESVRALFAQPASRGVGAFRTRRGVAKLLL